MTSGTAGFQRTDEQILLTWFIVRDDQDRTARAVTVCPVRPRNLPLLIPKDESPLHVAWTALSTETWKGGYRWLTCSTPCSIRACFWRRRAVWPAFVHCRGFGPHSTRCARCLQYDWLAGFLSGRVVKILRVAWFDSGYMHLRQCRTVLVPVLPRSFPSGSIFRQACGTTPYVGSSLWKTLWLSNKRDFSHSLSCLTGDDRDLGSHQRGVWRGHEWPECPLGKCDRWAWGDCRIDLGARRRGCDAVRVRGGTTTFQAKWTRCRSSGFHVESSRVFAYQELFSFWSSVFESGQAVHYVRLRSRANLRRQCGEHREFQGHVQWQGGVRTHQTHVSQLSVLRYSGAKHTFSLLQLGDDFSWWTTKSCFSWNCCVRVSDGLHDVCGYSGVCDFALRCSGARVFVCRRVSSPSWMDGSKTSVEDSAVTVQGTALVAAYVCHTGHSTAVLVSTTPPAEALAWPLFSLHRLLLAALGTDSACYCWCQTLLLRRSPDRMIFTVGAIRFRCGAHVWSSLTRKVWKARKSATIASERHFVFPVGHGVVVPICLYLMLCSFSRTKCWSSLKGWGIGMKPRLARLMSTSCRNCSVRKWRHCAPRPYTGAHSFSGSRLNSTVDFKCCASYCFAFRHLPGQSSFRSGFPQYWRTCIPGCQCALDDWTSQSRARRQYWAMHEQPCGAWCRSCAVQAPTLSWPSHFHTNDEYPIPHTSRFQPLTF